MHKDSEVTPARLAARPAARLVRSLHAARLLLVVAAAAPGKLGELGERTAALALPHRSCHAALHLCAHAPPAPVTIMYAEMGPDGIWMSSLPARERARAVVRESRQE